MILVDTGAMVALNKNRGWQMPGFGGCRIDLSPQPAITESMRLNAEECGRDWHARTV